MARVLVADDDADIRFALRTSLELEGYEVVECDTGRSALTTLDEQKFDAMLLDISLPDMEGMAVLRRARAIPALRTLPIIMVSGHQGAPTLEEARELGCTAYVVKPFRREDLLKTLQRALDP